MMAGGCRYPEFRQSQKRADGKISLNWPGIALFWAWTPGFWENLVLGGLGISSLADRHLSALNVTYAAPTQSQSVQGCLAHAALAKKAAPSESVTYVRRRHALDCRAITYASTCCHTVTSA
jgi:hypothetical protein